MIGTWRALAARRPWPGSVLWPLLAVALTGAAALAGLLVLTTLAYAVLLVIAVASDEPTGGPLALPFLLVLAGVVGGAVISFVCGGIGALVLVAEFLRGRRRRT